MRRKIVALSIGFGLLGGVEQVVAHHSFAATYDSGKKVEIEGVVKEFVWRNPHSFMRVDVTDKDGTTKTWALEWGSASQLAQGQISRTTLKPGDRIVVSGEPARDQSSARLLIQTVKRPADGWQWQGRVE
ncbi:MAG: hypothetical protein HOP16_11490 [Acidobacteria bacterium]|nr:hypothetical protein [Acidobacteriota bacterium]